MTHLSLSILDSNSQLRTGRTNYEAITRPMTVEGDNQICLCAQEFHYEDGDQILVKAEQPDSYLVVKLDETLDSTLIYLKGTEWKYTVSMDENRIEARPDKRFTSCRHYLSVRVARREEVEVYRNLALNPHDQKDFSGAYPHASANVETRNDATFFACNAIDGLLANCEHGSYPYQSWGINQQSDAALTIDFGRKVVLDQVVFTFRADFPHDNYWKQVSLTFSDGSTEIFSTKRTSEPQSFNFSKRAVESVIFGDLLKDETDPSPFPALVELELFGRNME